MFGIAKDTASRVSVAVDFFQVPDEIENSLGEVIFCAGAPEGASWEGVSSEKSDFADAGDVVSKF